MKPEIENLKAWMSGKSTTGYQRALAMREFEQLLTYLEELEQLRQPLVMRSVCEKYPKPTQRYCYECECCKKAMSEQTEA